MLLAWYSLSNKVTIAVSIESFSRVKSQNLPQNCQTMNIWTGNLEKLESTESAYHEIAYCVDAVLGVFSIGSHEVHI